MSRRWMLPAVMLTITAACSDNGMTMVEPEMVDRVAQDEQVELARKLDPSNYVEATQLQQSRSPAMAPGWVFPTYQVDIIGFAPEPGPFANNAMAPVGDDVVRGPHPIGFPFEFFGNTYTEFWVSSNGYISFTEYTYSGCCSGQPIPETDPYEYYPDNIIAIGWTDLDPRRGGSMSFETSGDEGNRRLIVSIDNIQTYGSWDQGYLTAQAILYERDNSIELHTTNLNSTRDRRWTQGIENADGTEAAYVPGRVAASFSLTEDAVRFSSNVPPIADASATATTVEWTSGPNVLLDGSASSDSDGTIVSWEWSEEGTPLGSGETFTATLGLGPHVITLTVTDDDDATASTEVVVDVVDTTPPEVTAELVPVADKSLKSKKGHFTVVFSCSDSCDENPLVTSVLLNDIPVEDGQIVDLRLKSKKSEKSEKSKKSKKSKRSKKSKKSEKPLKIEAPSFELVVTCEDFSGNVGTATAEPAFAEKSKKSKKSKKD